MQLMVPLTAKFPPRRNTALSGETVHFTPARVKFCLFNEPRSILRAPELQHEVIGQTTATGEQLWFWAPHFERGSDPDQRRRGAANGA